MLTKAEIYFWEMQGNDYKNAQFRLEYILRKEINVCIGTSSTVRKKMKYLENKHNIKFPKVNWKAIVGNDEDGGSMFKWKNT